MLHWLPFLTLCCHLIGHFPPLRCLFPSRAEVSAPVKQEEDSYETHSHGFPQSPCCNGGSGPISGICLSTLGLRLGAREGPFSSGERLSVHFLTNLSTFQTPRKLCDLETDRVLQLMLTFFPPYLQESPRRRWRKHRAEGKFHWCLQPTSPPMSIQSKQVEAFKPWVPLPQVRTCRQHV